jgi:hypothetical protein
MVCNPGEVLIRGKEVQVMNVDNFARDRFLPFIAIPGLVGKDQEKHEPGKVIKTRSCT